MPEPVLINIPADDRQPDAARLVERGRMAPRFRLEAGRAVDATAFGNAGV